MLNTERMANRLPMYLEAYRENSTIRAVLDAFGREMERAEENLGKLMKSKWFFHADLGDLERMGLLFGIPRLPGEMKVPYRQRFYLTVKELLTGAGTIDSISKIVEATIGTSPDIEENPAEIVESPVRELGSDSAWSEYNKSVKEDRPVITIRPLTRVRDPTVTNITTQESITYRGLLRKGSMLRILPDGTASLAGIDVSSRLEFYKDDQRQTEVLTPRVPKMHSEWKYTDGTGFFDYAHFSEAVFAAAAKNQVAVQLRWIRYRPATFNVRMALYSKGGRSTESIGYEKHLRQEVRHLVDHVKSAGVKANINFYDNFTEKNTVRDQGIEPSFGIHHTDRETLGEELEMNVVMEFCEQQTLGDRIYSCGVFDITEFDSANVWG